MKSKNGKREYRCCFCNSAKIHKERADNIFIFICRNCNKSAPWISRISVNIEDAKN